MHGVLMTGADRDVAGLAITCAALRRRKTVVVLSCAGLPMDTGANGDRESWADRLVRLARSVSVPVSVAGAGSAAAAIGRAIRRREAVLIAAPGGALDTDKIRRAAADLTAVLSGLRDLGLRADCLAWLDGVELMDPANVRELQALAPLTGVGMILSTADPAAAAQLAATTAVLAIGEPVGVDLEVALAGRLRDAGGGPADPIWRSMNRHRRGSRPGEVTMVVSSSGLDGSPCAITHCRLQPITQADS
jgi:hypothetical protein